MIWIFSESAPASLVSGGTGISDGSAQTYPERVIVKVYEPVIFVGESVPGVHGAFD